MKKTIVLAFIASLAIVGCKKEGEQAAPAAQEQVAPAAEGQPASEQPAGN